VIWELLRTNQPFDALLKKVPDEFYSWVKLTRENLAQQFTQIELHCQEVLSHAKDLPTRKEQAECVKRAQYPSVVFAMLDAKPYHDIIWKMLRPLAELPFRQGNEA
jgi:putative RNA ligase